MAHHRRRAERDSTGFGLSIPGKCFMPLISFSRCCVENKRGRIRRVKHRKTAVTISAALLASIVLADDFKTVNGKEYKNATVTRVEADGIIVRTGGGISKI